MKCISHPFRYFFILLMTISGYAVSSAEIIPPERRIDWNPGITAEEPERNVIEDVMSFGAFGDGITDDSQAFWDAINALTEQGGMLYIPRGTYLIKKKLSIDKGILIKGAGSDKTKLIFDLNKRKENCIEFVKYDRGDYIDVLEGAKKGSEMLIIENASGFKANDFIELRQDNDPDVMYTRSDWNQSWAQQAVGQLFRIKAVNNDTLFLEKSVYLDYQQELNPVVRKLGMVMFPGVEDLSLERLDAGDGHTIQMRYVAYGRVQRIESSMTYRTHVYLSDAIGCEVVQNYLHHSHDYGGGGHGYGVDVIGRSTDNLVMNNVFEYLRHSMMTHVGACGNVFAYNYSHSRHRLRLCDISIHGHYPYLNLFESNKIHEIDIADYWGPAGPGNTFLRNTIMTEGIDVMDESHHQNVVGNVLEKNNVSVNNHVNGTLTHGNVIGDMTRWDPNIDDHNIPVSLFLTEKPDFWGDQPWPIYGPDVDEQAQLPAEQRFYSGEPVTGVKQQSVTLPHTFRLAVYPNPFNPSSTVSFQLERQTEIEIRVYDINGRIVEKLLDSKLAAGHHSVRFTPKNISTGVYLIHIQGDDFSEMRKVSFIR